jgi:hypothetical protein
MGLLWGDRQAADGFVARSGGPDRSFYKRRRSARDQRGHELAGKRVPFRRGFSSMAAPVRRPQPPRVSLKLEQLENRSLLSAELVGDTLWITGTPHDDRVKLTAHPSSTELQVEVNGVVHRFAVDGSFQSIVIDTGDGNDRVFLHHHLNRLFPGEFPPPEIRIETGAGNDRVEGHRKLELGLFVSAGSGSDRVRTGRGDDRVLGGSGSDHVDAGGGDDEIFGDEGNDRLEGRGGDDYASGGPGRDRLWGNGGQDFLSGDEDADWLAGDPGSDILVGGDGRDFLNGGSGADWLDLDEEDRGPRHGDHEFEWEWELRGDLVPLDPSRGVTGRVVFAFEQEVEQDHIRLELKLSIQLQGAEPGATYDVILQGVLIGQITAGQDGSANVELTSSWDDEEHQGPLSVEHLSAFHEGAEVQIGTLATAILQSAGKED